jgi:hypothetical protein
MIFVAGAVLVALIASLTVTSCGKDKNVVAVFAQSMKQSPKKKNLGNIRINQEDMNPNQKKKKPSYHFKILKLKPDIKLIWINAMPGNDGYAQDLFNHITDENGFREFGLLIATNEELKNTRNNYARRCIVRVLDGPSTPESRLAVLHAFQLFVSRPKFNKYDYDYLVDHESNLTPKDDVSLVAMDHFILDDIIVNFIIPVYEETDANWYSKNVDSALAFFSGPSFPACAIEALSYPSNGPNNPGFATGYNLPIVSK